MFSQRRGFEEIAMRARSYRSIKELVFDIIRQTKGRADYETVTKAVKKYFPKSKWKESHWRYYRSQIITELLQKCLK